MIKFKDIIYEYNEPCCRSRWWQALAYRDPAARKDLMVIWPLHYAVQAFRWLQWKWDAYRHRPSWIDRHAKEAVKNHFRSPWC